MEKPSSLINTKSRRFSASNLRDDERFLRSAATISSTASSPGYMHTTRDEIDPSTYSFTAALKALQAKAVYSWEYVPSHRLTLHSKWSEAEKYISNPLSGRVPLECLSAKALSARSFSSLSNRITISAPLLFQTNCPLNTQHHHKLNVQIQEKKRSTTTKDAGTQSTPDDVSSGSPSPDPVATPPIQERLKKHSEGDSSVSKSEAEVEEREEQQEEDKEGRNRKGGRERKKKMVEGEGKGGRRGCLPFKGLWKWKWKRECKCKPRNNTNPSSSSPTFLYHFNVCFD